MAASNTLIIAGVVILFIGIILLIIGLALYENNVKTNTTQRWYVWVLIAGGVLIGLIGVVLFVWGLLSRPPEPIILVQPRMDPPPIIEQPLPVSTSPLILQPAITQSPITQPMVTSPVISTCDSQCARSDQKKYSYSTVPGTLVQKPRV